MQHAQDMLQKRMLPVSIWTCHGGRNPTGGDGWSVHLLDVVVTGQLIYIMPYQIQQPRTLTCCAAAAVADIVVGAPRAFNSNTCPGGCVCLLSRGPIWPQSCVVSGAPTYYWPVVCYCQGALCIHAGACGRQRPCDMRDTFGADRLAGHVNGVHSPCPTSTPRLWSLPFCPHPNPHMAPA